MIYKITCDKYQQISSVPFSFDVFFNLYLLSWEFEPMNSCCRLKTKQSDTRRQFEFMSNWGRRWKQFADFVAASKTSLHVVCYQLTSICTAVSKYRDIRPIGQYEVLQSVNIV